jgi:hypothetical protein
MAPKKKRKEKKKKLKILKNLVCCGAGGRIVS